MTQENLQGLGLTEDQAKKILQDLETNYVEKRTFDEMRTELKDAKKTIMERDTQIDALKKSSGSSEELKTEISKLQAENEKKDAAYATQLKQLKLDHAVEKALSDAKAINPATVKPLLSDFLSKAEVKEDGSVSGLIEEIEKLSKAKDTGFLFHTAKISGTAPSGVVTTPPDPKQTGYETRLADARKLGNAALAVAIKREAAADGVQLY